MKTLMIAASTAALALVAVPAVSQAQEVYGTVGYANVDADAPISARSRVASATGSTPMSASRAKLPSASATTRSAA